jgi:hypothetical protein
MWLKHVRISVTNLHGIYYFPESCSLSFSLSLLRPEPLTLVALGALDVTASMWAERKDFVGQFGNFRKMFTLMENTHLKTSLCKWTDSGCEGAASTPF